MALNHRLTIVGSDLHNNNLDIKIYVEGFAGIPVEREGTGESLSIEWGAPQNKLLPLIYGSAATVKFYAIDDYEFKDLYATNARDVYIEIWVNTLNLIWAGFMEPEKYSEPLISPGYEINFTAYDGLGLLKDEDFLTETKEYYEGTLTPIEIARLILAKTGLSLPLNTAINISPLGANPATDPITQYKIDLEVYRGLSCYEVLEQLFMNSRIFQRRGEWWIISNGRYTSQNITYHRYTAAGAAAGAAAFNARIPEINYEEIAKLEIIPAIKQIAYKQDYGFKTNLVQNPNFEQLDSGNISEWEIMGTVAPEQRIYDEDGNKFIYLEGRENHKIWDEPRTNGIRTAPIPVVATANKPTFTVSFAVAGNQGMADNLFIGIKLIADNNTEYCVIPQLLWDNKTIVYLWDQRSTVHPLPVPIKVTHKKHFFKADSYFPDPDFTDAYPIEEVVNHFTTNHITLHYGIPATGQLHIYLYLPNSKHAGIKGSCWRNIGMKFLNDVAEELPTGTEKILVNNLRNNFTPSDLEFVNGSVPYETESPATMVYNGGFVYPDGLPANTWKIDTSTHEFDYAELMVRIMADELRNPKQSVKARLIDVAPSLAMAFADPGNPGHLFLESGITYDFIMNTIEGTFIEIRAPYPDGFIISELPAADKTTDGKTKTALSTNPPRLDNDERVKMITPTFEVVNQAGYLSTDYFVQEIDGITGRAIITPRQFLNDGFIIYPVVTWLYGLTFHISHSRYVIMGWQYFSIGGTITLDAAHPTLPRIDVFAVVAEQESLPVAITGTPAPSPLKSPVDAAHQLEITFVIVEPGATQPTNITDEIIYDENIEWAGAVAGTLTANFDSTAQALTGTKSAEIITPATDDTITFTAAALKTFTDYEILSLFLFLKENAYSTHSLLVQFLKNGSPVSDEVNLPFDRNGADGWQNLAVNLTAFTLTDTEFNAVRFRWAHNGPSAFVGFHLDLIRLQKVITQPEPPATEQKQSDWDQTDTAKVDYIKNKPTIPAAPVNADWDAETGLAKILNKPTVPSLNANYLKDWQDFTFEDVEPGTAKEYVIDLKAMVGYTINSMVLETDTGTLTGIALKINGTAVTGLASVTATTTITETAATAANTAAVGAKITFHTTAGYTGAPTRITGKINFTRN